jgi:hypothetical protein
MIPCAIIKKHCFTIAGTTSVTKLSKNECGWPVMICVNEPHKLTNPNEVRDYKLSKIVKDSVIV